MLHTCPKSLGSRTRPFKLESSYTNLPYCYFLKGIVSTLCMGICPCPEGTLGFVVSSMKDRVYVYPHENEFVEAMCSKLTNYHCSQGRHGP